VTIELPAMTRREAAGPESARGLLITVLGEFVRPAGAPVWTSAFLDILGRLGVEQKASRQALMRLAASGWLSRERHGRRTLWQLSPHAVQFLTDGAERIYSFRGAQQGWDGRWLLVLARVPETERGARHLLRTRLTWAGFGSPAPGVWVTTHPDRSAEAEAVLGQAGVRDAQIFLARHHGGGDLLAMVRQAWDLAAIERRYAEFLAAFTGPPPGDPMVQLVQLVHAWRRFPLIDPALPEELLPTQWSGAPAAGLFGRLRAGWLAEANAEWAAVAAAGSTAR
jgi:phenylacetic acid degradation operon negative regulatory protein